MQPLHLLLLPLLVRTQPIYACAEDRSGKQEVVHHINYDDSMTRTGALCNILNHINIVGIFFFEDNNYFLVKGDRLDKCLAKVAKEKKFLLIGCDQCRPEPGTDGSLVEGATIRRLPGTMPDQASTL